MKILTYIDENEKFEVQQLFERMNSLKSMVATLADAKLSIDEENWFYKKLMDDITNTDENYKNWWDKTCDKYKLEKENSHNYIVNFKDNFISLN